MYIANWVFFLLWLIVQHKPCARTISNVISLYSHTWLSCLQDFLFFLDQTGNYMRVTYPVNSNYSFLRLWQRITLLADTPVVKIRAALTHLLNQSSALRCHIPPRTPRSRSEDTRCHGRAWAGAGRPKPSEEKKRGQVTSQSTCCKS